MDISPQYRLTPEQIREALKDRKLNEVAERVGFSYSTVRRFANDKNYSPPYHIWVKMNDYLAPKIEG